MISDKRASVGSVYVFIMLVVCLAIGAFIWIILSPLFASINDLAISTFSAEGASAKYPENVQQNTIFILQFIEYSVLVFALFVFGLYLKGYLQPWTRGL